MQHQDRKKSKKKTQHLTCGVIPDFAGYGGAEQRLGLLGREAVDAAETGVPFSVGEAHGWTIMLDELDRAIQSVLPLVHEDHGERQIVGPVDGGKVAGLGNPIHKIHLVASPLDELLRVSRPGGIGRAVRGKCVREEEHESKVVARVCHRSRSVGPSGYLLRRRLRRLVVSLALSLSTALPILSPRDGLELSVHSQANHGLQMLFQELADGTTCFFVSAHCLQTSSRFYNWRLVYFLVNLVTKNGGFSRSRSRRLMPYSISGMREQSWQMSLKRHGGEPKRRYAGAAAIHQHGNNN